MRRSTTYVNRNRCDWCGCELPPIHRMNYKRVAGLSMPFYDSREIRDMVKFVSPIDGNYVRARLCPEHLGKLKPLCEVAA